MSFYISPYNTPPPPREIIGLRNVSVGLGLYIKKCECYYLSIKITNLCK